MSTQAAKADTPSPLSQAPLTVQNSELSSLIQPDYTSTQLEALRQALVAHHTLSLRRYKKGGHSAVTILETVNTLERAIDGLLVNQWDRDNIMQALAEKKLAEDDDLRAGLQTDTKSWRRGLISSLVHHKKCDYRFVNIIEGRESASNMMVRPHIRYNCVNQEEVGDAWGHAQNDSLSFVNFLLFHGLRKGDIGWMDADIQPIAMSYASLLHAFFWKVQVWEEFDLGAWEDHMGLHWSSVACVLVSLREQLAYFEQSKLELDYNKDGKVYRVRVKGIKELIDKCEAMLVELDNNEFIAARGGKTRSSDLAMVNPLLLAAFAGQPVISDENTEAILAKIEEELLGPIGVRRYMNDVWDGRENRKDLEDGEEAQWVHGSPQMSYIYADLYNRTGEERFYQKQLWHFNRAMASIAPSWLPPEAWIVDPNSRKWIPDENEPLAWTQSMLVLAVAGMKQSIAKKEAAAAAPETVVVEETAVVEETEVETSQAA